MQEIELKNKIGIMFLKKRLETIFHRIIRKTGYDVVKCKFSKHELEVEQLLKYLNINTVIDIGANEGQYSKNIRIGGYKQRIISFEPVNASFAGLEKISAKDALWDIYNFALGNFDGESEINISQNSVSSSILGIREALINAAPQAQFIGKQRIKVRKLDSIFKELNVDPSNIFIKIDTQGFEKNVLLGARETLKSIKAIQVEMSTQHLYQDEDLFYQVSEFLYDEGFRLVKIVRGFTNSTGELLEFDGVFMRN